MGKNITTKEIAKLAKVSVGTVDRVLHNRGQVSEKTKWKILEIIKSGDYRPNLFARNLALNRTFNIISLMPAFKPNEYWEAPSLGFTQAIAELKQFGLSHTPMTYDNTLHRTFETLAAQIIDSQPDAVIIAPVFHIETKALSKQLEEAKIPYVFIDSNLSDLAPLSFVGQDSYQSGYLAAKLLDFGSAQATRYFIISILDEQENNLINSQRIAGFEAYLKQKNLFEKIERLDVKFDNLTKKLDQILEASKDELNIFVPNSKVHQVATRLETKRNSRSIKLLGYDLIKDNKTQLEKGNIDFVIDQKAQFQGYKAIQLLYQHLVLKQVVNQAYFMPLDIITKENLMYCET